MSKTQAYKVIFEPAEEGGYTVYVPSLPGCISEGDTYEEALANVKEAIKGWIEVSEQFGDEIPQWGNPGSKPRGRIFNLEF
ncbi:type II toxin-antitoxin system HicB family antitoxin [Acetomicrobium sp. UBA5826]|uniref:type II toxin-antitoxin system HicB family antitoxin n=1 Tax=Acetomicrobium sp. UBA5826 TaxID=1946039 RepID=UPI00257CB190|nr:type II toxin-antitoxin system HicB family antitoxin [Acetomicrobium sp. UBA5826]